MRREERLDDQELSIREALETQQSKMWTAIPAIVVDVDLDTQTLSAQPAIQAVVRDKDNNTSNVSLPVLINVPIVFPRAGGFALTLPITSGDEVLIVFGARCIDSWWQSGGIGVQAEQRMHDLSDGFAILAPTSQPKKLTGVSSDSVQIRNYDGGTYVEIDSSGKINLVSGSEIEISAPTIKLDGDVEITKDLLVGGNVQLSADLFVDGNAQVSGDLSVDGRLVNQGIVFLTHVHGGVTTGGGTTLPPS
jgi:hypothetical protein